MTSDLLLHVSAITTLLRVSVFKLFAGLVVSTIATAPAYAVDTECEGGGLDETGRCYAPSEGIEDVEWCTADGQYRRIVCAVGEICAEIAVTDDDGESLGFTCIDKAATECADIPDDGTCPSPEVVLWCNNGQPETYNCEGDTECARTATGHDCVAKGRIPAGDDAPDSPPDEQVEPPPEVQSSELGEVLAGGPTPSSSPGLGYSSQGGHGCSTSDTRPPVAWVVVLLLLLLLAMGRAPTRATKSSRCRRP